MVEFKSYVYDDIILPKLGQSGATSLTQKLTAPPVNDEQQYRKHEYCNTQLDSKLDSSTNLIDKP